MDDLYEPSNDVGALDCFVEVYTGDPGPRPEALVPTLNCPVCVIWGDADQWTPVDGVLANFFKRRASSKATRILFHI